MVNAEITRKPMYVRVFHWALVLLFAIAFLTAYRVFDFRTDMPGELRDFLFAAHRLSGMLAGLLLFIWFLIVLKNAVSAIRNGVSFRLLWVFHFAMGVACFILPVLPWIARSREGRTFELYTLWPHFNLASPPTTNFVYKLLDQHKQMAEIVGVLLALHIAGALFHKFVLKDKSFWRMWFGKG
jgi:cytochrome b561